MVLYISSWENTIYIPVHHLNLAQGYMQDTPFFSISVSLGKHQLIALHHYEWTRPATTDTTTSLRTYQAILLRSLISCKYTVDPELLIFIPLNTILPITCIWKNKATIFQCTHVLEYPALASWRCMLAKEAWQYWQDALYVYPPQSCMHFTASFISPLCETVKHVNAWKKPKPNS